MNQGNHEYDLVIFGATGFVGQIVCAYLVELIGTESNIRWAVAGRSQAKLDRLVQQLETQGTRVPQIVADANDESSLRSLCDRAQVVVSTVGPYALYGEPLVKVCAETGTDYCDLTGEFQWVRRMVQAYETTAKQSGARIVHCCGFDSVPADLGVYYLQQKAQQRFGHSCPQVKMRVKDARGGLSGGTVASGIHLVKEADSDPQLRQELQNLYSLCPETFEGCPPIQTLSTVDYDEVFQSWIAPYIMAEVDTRIVLRSNALLGDAYGPKFHYDEAILTGPGPTGWAIAQGLKLTLDSLVLASAWTPTRQVLEQWIVPSPGDGPDRESRDNGFYDLRFWGRTAAGETLEVKVTGDRDPGYGSTAKILGQAGLCLAQDISKSDRAGGFWTPATLFGTTLIDRLTHHAGLSFNVV